MSETFCLHVNPGFLHILLAPVEGNNSVGFPPVKKQITTFLGGFEQSFSEILKYLTSTNFL